MTYLRSLAAALLIAPLASMSNAAPITAEYILDIDTCAVFDTGAPVVMASDCTGLLTITTDTDITFGTPDAEQTGGALLEINSPTYGTSSAVFFNFLEFVFTDANGNDVPVCLEYCFYTDYDTSEGLSFGWLATRGLPYSNGEYTDKSNGFDYESKFYRADGASFGLITNGQIRIAAVPLPATGLLLLGGILGLSRLRKTNRT